MRFWLSPRSDVPLREQLTTQIMLGILSDDLRPGARLPSTRELARRFGVHANTVSAAYKQLEQERWLEFRHGSGVYVRGKQPARRDGAAGAEALIAGLLRSTRKVGVPLGELRAHLRQWLAHQPPDHFVVIDDDAELRAILMHELSAELSLPVRGCSIAECARRAALEAAMPLAMFSRVEQVRAALPAASECLELRVRSVPQSLAAYLPARKDALIAVVSRWPGFLARARTMLLAAAFDGEALMVCDAREAGWQKGLSEAAAVVCDSLMATKLPRVQRKIAFPLLAESTIAELRRYEEFIAAG